MEALGVIARRGWYSYDPGIFARQFAPRQCVRWNDKEDFDLAEQYYRYGVPIEWIAEYHQRSLGGIRSRLDDPERAIAGHDRYVAGTPKPKLKGQKWASGSSRKRLKHLKEKNHGSKRSSGHHQSGW